MVALSFTESKIFRPFIFYPQNTPKSSFISCSLNFTPGPLITPVCLLQWPSYLLPPLPSPPPEQGQMLAQRYAWHSINSRTMAMHICRAPSEPPYSPIPQHHIDLLTLSQTTTTRNHTTPTPPPPLLSNQALDPGKMGVWKSLVGGWGLVGCVQRGQGSPERPISIGAH